MNTSLDKLAILIPTRHRPGILATTLGALRAVGLGAASLFVYDDASEDVEPVRRVVGSWPGATLICGEKRVGQAGGRNLLMRASGKEYGLQLDDDSFPEDADWVSRVVKAMPGPHCVAITTFQCRSIADGKLSVPSERTAGFSRSFLGGASLFHIPSVLAVSGFRECFIYGYEEPELALRLWLNGYRIWCDPSVVINHNHFEASEEKRDHREYDYLYARNGILMSSLNMPLWYGLPHGLGRSVRRSVYRKRNLGVKLQGTLAGICLTFALWQQRTPCTWRNLLGWLRFGRWANC